jgi:hypothetical protein
VRDLLDDLGAEFAGQKFLGVATPVGVGVGVVGVGVLVGVGGDVGGGVCGGA